MKMYHISLDVVPFPQPRPRVTRWNTYDPAKSKKEALRKRIAEEWERLGQTAPLSGPLVVTAEFGMPIPKGTSMIKKEAMIFGDIKHTKLPDTDNIAKACTDSCNGILWDDDKQIYALNLSKFYADQPYIKLWIQKEG